MRGLVDKPMEIGHIRPTERERRLWAWHASGKAIPVIADLEGCDEKVARRVISEIWAKDREYHAALKRKVRQNKVYGRGDE